MAITYSVNICGDKLETTWNGSVFVGSNGQQFSTKKAALESEILAHYLAGQQEISADEMRDILATIQRDEK